jgi:hypothetical protein
MCLSQIVIGKQLGIITNCGYMRALNFSNQIGLKVSKESLDI